MKDVDTLGHRRGWVFPVAVALALGLLLAGLFLPMVSVHKFVIRRHSYSVVGGILRLYGDGSVFLASVVALFSVVFPVAKLVGLLVLWFRPTRSRARRQWIRAMAGLGKWSMLDVFLVAVLIASATSRWYLKIESKPGVYVFCAAILATAILTEWAARMERKSGEEGPGPEPRELEPLFVAPEERDGG